MRVSINMRDTVLEQYLAKWAFKGMTRLYIASLPQQNASKLASLGIRLVLTCQYH